MKEEGWHEREEGSAERDGMREKDRAREMKEVERWRVAWCAGEGEMQVRERCRCARE